MKKNLRKSPKRQKCFLVCNAHLDPVWLWPWEEGLAEAISTFRVAADFIDEHPEFVFNHNESLLYEWVERNDPELFERIRKHVKSGRWHIAGGAYLQPDLTAASGESVIRQFLVGKRYFSAKFGVEPKVAYNFDTFGHPQGVIQILAGCGFDAYVFCRPNAGQMKLPVGSFIWRHSSGAEIVARRSDDHYITQGEIRKQMLGRAVQGNENDLENDMREGSWPAHYRDAEGDFMFLWGLGNHGGGASREEYAQFAGMRADFPNVEFIESNPDDFFKHTLKVHARSDMPVVSGDFNQIHEGCYTSMLRIKQQHRRLENLAHMTEKICAMAWWKGRRDYPSKDLEVAWKDILFSEFHDILPGSGIPQVEEDSLKMLGHAEEILRRKKVEAMISLLRDEPLSDREITPFFIFNPHNWEVTREVEVEYGTARQAGTDAIVRTVFCDGKKVEAQFEKGDLNLDNPGWGEWRQKAVFKVTVPPFSYKRFDAEYCILPPEKVQRWKSPAMPKGDKLVINGDAMSVAVSLKTGLVDRVKVDGREQVKPGSFKPTIFDDIPHSWNAADVWKQSAENFRLATPEETARILNSEKVNPGYAAVLNPVRILEDGPVRTVVEALFVSGHTSLVQRYKINKKSAVLQVELDVLWTERDKMFKLGFTPAAALARIWAEKCYSVDDETDAVDRPDRERTFQHFLRLTDTKGGNGLGVISHGTHGYHQKGGTTWLSVLRSPAYACMDVAGDWQRYLNRYIPHHEQGERRAQFTFIFGRSAADSESMVRKSYEHNVGLEQMVYFPTRRTDEQVKPASFVTTDRKNVILVAMKKAEQGEALILRFWEVAGKNTPFTMTVDGRRCKAEIGAHRLLTYRLERKTGKLLPTDLLERNSRQSLVSSRR
ncbi:MAG: glycoside hydrolase family 38 C-terminal domain-containing protein [Victivallales bacterium]|jgi:alpha-mannosidase